MKVGVYIESESWEEVAKAARRAEDLSFDTFVSNESAHNPFFPLVVAAQHTERIGLLTSIALAFPRSPMDTAYMAWDLQAQSKGRFMLGLGSQVKGHIVRRYSVNWTPPAPRMREYVLALRAIWKCWQDGTRLDFHGDHYNFNLMTPFFSPGPTDYPDLDIFVSAVNPYMLRVAGEVCDGVLLHTFNSASYTTDVIMPNLERGAARRGRDVKDLQISGGGFVIAAVDDEDVSKHREKLRSRIAFYASTRSYAPVMRAHDWGDVAERLYRMSTEGKWSQMGNEITDEMIDTFAVVGTYEQIPDMVKARFGSYGDSVALHNPLPREGYEDRIRAMVEGIHKL